jgi:predicted metal-dependent hydrolase
MTESKMDTRPHPNQAHVVPVAWCNGDAVTSSVMEAVSFVTPVLENFFIRTVLEGMREHGDKGLEERCLSFVREEANHTQAHRKFNVPLLGYLGRQPPGLAMVEFLLDAAKRHLSLSKRLALAAALEHFAAVISKLYVSHEAKLTFELASAKELFAMHAREELAHRSVVFDLWQAHGSRGFVDRFTTIMATLMVGATYVGIAVPWILHRKMERHFIPTILALSGFTAKNLKDTLTHTPVAELLSFVRRDFHPESLIDDAQVGKV